jgi:aryl-alcohol dehydrogenase-like predicted oxidoreductase
MRLALGTAQFGLNYGVSNTSGQVAISEIKDILLEAKAHNIDTIDTAIAYGNCEEVLGNTGVDGFNIITKLPPVPEYLDDSDLWVSNQIKSSLSRMKLNKISGVLLHRASDFLTKPEGKLFDSLRKLKDNGIIDKIGVSIYNPSELDDLEKHGIEIDIVQSPFNIFDRRLESSGWLNKLRLAGVEIHTRSVFLQGLLLQSHSQRNGYFNSWSNHLNNFDEWVFETNQTALGASLNFQFSYDQITKIIIGVQSKPQLSEILRSNYEGFHHQIPKELEIDDPLLLNPQNWKL